MNLLNSRKPVYTKATLSAWMYRKETDDGNH